MKTKLQNLFIALALLAGVHQAAAQTFTNLHNFARISDGANPYAGLILSGHTLYGTASSGGPSGNGTVFAVNTDGTGFTNLHNFAFGEGINPFAGLILSGNTLYGTAYNGGTYGNGAVFGINTDGTGFTNPHNFTGGSDGATPIGGLILSGNTLYGTAYEGSSGFGVVFSVTTGMVFAKLYSFTGGSDGAAPAAGLILSGNTLYGTASQGGTHGSGTVFAVNTDGTGFTNLYSFTGGSDGANPYAGLILSGNTLYGTASQGGPYGSGTVFAVNTDGTGFTNLYSFTTSSYPNYTNSDGAGPTAGLILSGNTLYGTTPAGGSAGVGVVFAVNTDGTGFTNLYNFTGGSDGANPKAGLIVSGNTLYGTTMAGGSGGYGTIFAITPDNSVATPIPLQIQSAGNAVVLSWTDSTFALQSAPVVTGTYTNIPGAATPYTNPVSGAQQFFRLSKP
jgi:uncharacterized repeat protein (TIGR03803 family)